MRIAQGLFLLVVEVFDLFVCGPTEERADLEHIENRVASFSVETGRATPVTHVTGELDFYGASQALLGDLE